MPIVDRFLQTSCGGIGEMWLNGCGRRDHGG